MQFFSFIIACSTLGNVLSTTFAFGRGQSSYSLPYLNLPIQSNFLQSSKSSGVKESSHSRPSSRVTSRGTRPWLGLGPSGSHLPRSCLPLPPAMHICSCSIVCISHMSTNNLAYPDAVSSYPFAIFNTLIPAALLLVRLAPERFAPAKDWLPPFRTPLVALALYFAGNLLLVVAPLLPPERGFEVYAHLPYWVR